MSYYKKLKLPFPLKDSHTLEKLVDLKKNPTNSLSLYDTVITDYAQYLNTELLQVFEKLQVDVSIMLFLGYPDNRPLNQQMHVDIQFDGTQWQPVCCALNWEFNLSYITMSWYENSANLLSIEPPVAVSRTGMYSGRHFGHRGNKSTDGFTLLDTYCPTMDAPVLIRTDVPHKVIMHPKESRRLCLSLRFSNIHTWEHAQKIFKNFAYET